MLAAGRDKAVTVTWRRGSKAAMTSCFVSLRVRLAGRRPKPAADDVIGLTWLIAQWPEGEDEPVKYSRYRGLANTRLQHHFTGAAVNLARIDAWLTGRPLAKTRVSPFSAFRPAG